MALLELDGIDAHYGRIQALRGVTMKVEKGEIVALIGSNGAGKTTTLRTISGLMHPSAGTIRFDGKEITRTPPSQIVGLGISQSPEGRRLFPRMSVLDNLFMGAYSRNDKAGITSDMDNVFKLFPRLLERRTQISGTLSGGEQQMLAIGRALMLAPKLVLLDEPSMGLAPIVIDEVFRRLVDLKGRGLTMLLVEQLAYRALDLADYAYVIEHGRIELEGPAHALRDDPRVREAYLGEGAR